MCWGLCEVTEATEKLPRWPSGALGGQSWPVPLPAPWARKRLRPSASCHGARSPEAPPRSAPFSAVPGSVRNRHPLHNSRKAPGPPSQVPGPGGREAQRPQEPARKRPARKAGPRCPAVRPQRARPRRAGARCRGDPARGAIPRSTATPLRGKTNVHGPQRCPHPHADLHWALPRARHFIVIARWA